MENLSGGELQRFAIAVVAAQDGEPAEGRLQHGSARGCPLPCLPLHSLDACGPVSAKDSPGCAVCVLCASCA